MLSYSESAENSPLLVPFQEEHNSSNHRREYGLVFAFRDFCLTFLFYYLMLFVANISEMSVEISGCLIIIGQIAHEQTASIVVWLFGAGDRVVPSAHAIGSFLVSLTYPLIMLPNTGYSSKYISAELFTLLWCGFIIICFQIGCALMQVSHLSMISTLERNDVIKKRKLREMGIVFSCVVTYILCWSLFPGSSIDHKAAHLGPDGRILTMIVGSAVFIYSTWSFVRSKVPEYSEIPKFYAADPITMEEYEDDCRRNNVYPVHVALLYGVAKVYSVVSTLYIKLWIDERATANKRNAALQGKLIDGGPGIEDIALIPIFLIPVFIAGMAAFLTFPKLLKSLRFYISGVLLCFLGTILLVLHQSDTTISVWNHIYGLAILIGLGTSMAIVSSGFMVSELISQNSGRSTYVLVTYSERVILGLLVIIAQYMIYNEWVLSSYHYQTLLLIISTGAAFVAVATAISLGSIKNSFNLITTIKKCFSKIKC